MGQGYSAQEPTFMLSPTNVPRLETIEAIRSSSKSKSPFYTPELPVC